MRRLDRESNSLPPANFMPTVYCGPQAPRPGDPDDITDFQSFAMSTPAKAGKIVPVKE